MTLIQVSVEGKDIQKIEISPNASTSEILNAFWSLANIAEGDKEHHILKLYRSDGALIPIGPHIPPADNAYTLRLKKGIRWRVYVYSCDC